jgi:hypothetical protein
MLERGIDDEDIRSVLEFGETIEDYAEDFPYPSRLVLGWPGSRPLHLMVARNVSDEERIVITVYHPDPDRWEDGFRRRRMP